MAFLATVLLLEAWAEPGYYRPLLLWAPEYNKKFVSKASSLWVQAVLYPGGPEPLWNKKDGPNTVGLVLCSSDIDYPRLLGVGGIWGGWGGISGNVHDGNTEF